MKPLNMADDSHIPTPKEMAALWFGLTEGVEPDYYGNGGAVESFERQVAAFLGKDRAVMFPTGTLGNLLAMLRLTGGAPARVVLHRQSHLFNDAGDNISQLGGLTMVPLDGAGAGFSEEALKAEILRTASARVGSRIGAVAVESPSRRMHNRAFGPELPGVIEVARAEGLPLFLDGARMLIECAWTGQDPQEMAAPFDLVYLSLYKYLKAPFGCVIAGPEALFEGIHHDRRRFGGSLYQMWPAAVLAADALPRQADLWAEARPLGAAVVQALRARGIDVTTFHDGSNVFVIDCPGAPDSAQKAGKALGVSFLPTSNGRLSVKVNETWIGRDPEDLAGVLVRILQANRT